MCGKIYVLYIAIFLFVKDIFPDEDKQVYEKARQDGAGEKMWDKPRVAYSAKLGSGIRRYPCGNAAFKPETLIRFNFWKTALIPHGF